MTHNGDQVQCMHVGLSSPAAGVSAWFQADIHSISRCMRWLPGVACSQKEVALARIMHQCLLWKYGKPPRSSCGNTKIDSTVLEAAAI